MSKQAFASELKRSAMLDIPYVVLHPGSHTETGEETGLARIAEAINQVFDHVSPSGTRLLLETTAGQGSNLGYTFEQPAFLIKSVRHKDRVGVCLDTCHVFAAGYDIRTPKTYKKTASFIL
jgi:deoxyribonuclease-4